MDLDADLASPPGPGGRHPLPAAEKLQRRHAPRRRQQRSPGRGVRPGHLDGGRARLVAAALLRPPDVSVLDGGLAAWIAAGRPVASGQDEVGPGDFTARPGGMLLIDAGGAAGLARRGVLLDARAPERFHGELEPIDPVAGHIPGARNRPTAQNVDASGRFLDPADLRVQFAHSGAGEGVELGAYCGSGVTRRPRAAGTGAGRVSGGAVRRVVERLDQRPGSPGGDGSRVWITRTPERGASVIPRNTVSDGSGLAACRSVRSRTRARTVRISIRANVAPRQRRVPPPNGIHV